MTVQPRFAASGASSLLVPPPALNNMYVTVNFMEELAEDLETDFPERIRALYPDYELWRDFPYEYELDKLAIDVINGSPLLREWVDDPAAAPGDLDALALPDEQAWNEARRPFVLY